MPEHTAIAYGLFCAFILSLLALDLGFFQRTSHAPKLREAIGWCVAWVLLALSFNVFIYFMYQYHWLDAGLKEFDAPTGAEAALQFFTGYLIEQALSVDNIFVFIIIFAYFGVPAQYQHKILFWGILGAIVMRLVFIVSGALLISRFEWILYLFGAVLIVSGWKMLTQSETRVHPENNVFIRLARRLFPILTGFDSPAFITRKGGKLHITTMLLVLITVETTDVVFAVDSIPAIFAVTRDPFIVFTSNIFAILGLRSLYFVLAGMMNTFHYLKTGLSLVLLFIGTKMLINDLLHVPVAVSLLVVGCILMISIVASLVRLRRIKHTGK